jgi:hypothetical protein
VSSLSVAYSTTGPRDAGEDFDALPHLRGLRLGYAQTKAVGEALVRQAAERGLPAKIYRPSLISGDSRTGAFNRDDLLSAMVSGCIRMRSAPDLDWKVDCVPVVLAARAIVDLSGADGDVIHLPHERPRHWRECVLWMRLYGYDVRLVSYHTWLKQLDREAETGHPLRPLRSFFLDRPAGGGGLTIPELYEETRRTRALAGRTIRACPPLDASLLDRYFSAFVAAGHVPAPSPPQTQPVAARSDDDLRFDCDFFRSALAQRGSTIVGVQPLGSGSDHSIVSELTSWRSRAASPSGLYRFAVTVEDGVGRSVRRVVVKIKPEDVDVIAVGEALAHLCDDEIGRLTRDGAAGSGSSARICVSPPSTRRPTHGSRCTRHRSRACYRSAATRPLIVLEEIADGVLMNTADTAGVWRPQDIDCAIRGLSALQAICADGKLTCGYGVAWLHRVCFSRGRDVRSLASARRPHGAGVLSLGRSRHRRIQRRLIAECGHWWRWMETEPRTLIHHDFNPRNICLRGYGAGQRLCAYDWELATLGAPQRDLAELLTFVLPLDATRAEAQHWIDVHRASLERETGVAIDADAWLNGFRAGLYDLMLNRLPMYALVNRVRRQPFLSRVVRTWRRLYQHFPLESP